MPLVSVRHRQTPEGTGMTRFGLKNRYRIEVHERAEVERVRVQRLGVGFIWITFIVLVAVLAGNIHSF